MKKQKICIVGEGLSGLTAALVLSNLDIDVDFSPDMGTAILTFYADGSYSVGDSDEKVDYSTRASSVWIATDSGWKTVHTNWAPYGGGSGIPKN